MKDLLKYTYLLDVKEVEKSIDRLWKRYQKILDNQKSDWKDLNEARAILYFLGYLYPEKIALDSLERRVGYIKPKIDLDVFLSVVDGKKEKFLKKYKNNKNFKKLEKFYLIVKNLKNLTKNNTYLDEGRFNDFYLKLTPKDYF